MLDGTIETNATNFGPAWADVVRQIREDASFYGLSEAQALAAWQLGIQRWLQQAGDDLESE